MSNKNAPPFFFSPPLKSPLFFLFIFIFSHPFCRHNTYLLANMFNINPQRFIEGYVRNMKRYKVVIWICFLLVLGACGWLAPKFIPATSQTFNPPDNSESAKAREVMNEAFPNIKNTADLALFIKYKHPTNASILTNQLEAFSIDFCKRAAKWPGGTNILLSCGGYYSFEAMDAGSGATFVNGAQDATFISITLGADCTSNHACNFANWLEDHAAKDAREANNAEMYDMTFMGCSAFLRVMIKNSSSDLERMDAVVLPLSMLLLAFILGSLRLLLASICCLLSAMAISFGVMYLITFGMDIFASAPSLMMSLMIAMSIDYGLFLLSRYSEELKLQVESCGEFDTPAAVVQMLLTAGHTISVSGLTLAVSFLGLTFFKLNIIQSFGVGCGTVLLIVLLTNLFLIPLLLLSFPGFFEKCRSKAKKESDVLNADGFVQNTTRRSHADPHCEEESATTSPLLEDNRWYKLGLFVTSYPTNICVVLVVLGAVAPFSPKSFSYTTTDENLLYLPKGEDVTKAYVEMGDAFGYGQIYAYSILFLPNGTQPLIDPDAPAMWSLTQRAILGLASLPFDTNTSDYNAPSYAGGVELSAVYTTLCSAGAALDGVTCQNFYNDEEPNMFTMGQECRPLFLLACMCLNNQTDVLSSTAMIARFTPRFASMSPVGRDWLYAARDYAEEFYKETDMKVLIIGTPADSIDAMASVDSDFDPMVAITTTVLFLFVLFSFKSLFIPLRSVVTIGVTVVWVYGFATMTYEDCSMGWMHFMGFDCTHAIVYIVPLMSFSIVVGIGLDYDVFLVTRIVECYQEEGLSTQQAICQGLAHTGYIITAAGVIMAMAFCGLFFSKEPFMHQLSFYMVCGFGEF